MKKALSALLCFLVFSIFSTGYITADADNPAAYSEKNANIQIYCDSGLLYKGQEVTWTVQYAGGISSTKFMLYGGEYGEDYSTYMLDVNEMPFIAEEENTSGVFKFTPSMDSGLYWLIVYLTDNNGDLYYASEYYAGGNHADDNNPGTLSGRVHEIVDACERQNYADPYDVALYMHDCLINNANYDRSYTYFYPDGVLLKGSGVCQSYSLAYQILMREMGIQSLYVTGEAGNEAHSWNMICINGEWGHVDCTWDDPNDGGEENRRFFYVGDNQLRNNDHIWEASYYPACAEKPIRPQPIKESVSFDGLFFSDENGNQYSTGFFEGNKTIVIYEIANCGWGNNMIEYASSIMKTLNTNQIRVIVIVEDTDLIGGLESFSSQYPDIPFYTTLMGGKSVDWSILSTLLPGVPKDSLVFPSVFLVGPDGCIKSHFLGYSPELLDQMIVDAAAMDESGLFTWVESEGHICITGYNGQGFGVQIPATINGKTVTALGAGIFENNTELVSITIPDSVQTIGDHAFCGAVNLKEVRLPDGLTSLGESTFEGCSSLQKIILPESLESIDSACFKNSGIGNLLNIGNVYYPFSFTFGSSVRFMADDAFEGCFTYDNCDLFAEQGSYAADWIGSHYTAYGFRSRFMQCLNSGSFMYRITNDEATVVGYTGKPETIVVPNEVSGYPVTSIGEKAFADCETLRKVTIPSNIREIRKDAFRDCIYLEEFIMEDGGNAVLFDVFEGCKSLTKLKLSNSLEKIDRLLLVGNEAVSDITIPGNVEYIDSSALCGPTLRNIVIEEGVKELRYRCFEVLSHLETITIPASVISIDKDAFYNCYPQSITYIGSGNIGIKSLYTVKGSYAEEFFQTHYPAVEIKYLDDSNSADFSYTVDENNTAMITGCHTQAENVFIPSQIDGYRVVTIGSCSFAGNTQMKRIVMSDTIKYVEDGAFMNCTGLEEVSMSLNLNSIGTQAFYGCTSLKEIAVPNSVTSVGKKAFMSCSSLERASISYRLDILDEDVFNHCASLRSILIPVNISAIGKNCFQGAGLTEVFVYQETASIDPAAFADCDKLSLLITDPESFAETYFRERDPDISIRYSEIEKTLKYEIRNGTCVISGCYGDPVNLVIPSTISGYEVTEIGAIAFTRCYSLEKVVLPETLRTISYSAFESAGGHGEDANTFSIELNEGLTSIDFFSFGTVEKLEELYIPGTVITIGEVAFQDCTSLKKLKLAEGITGIGAGAFERTYSLTEVVIPSTVEIIDSDSFKESGIHSVTILNADADIGNNAFEFCENLTTVYVSREGTVSRIFAEEYPEITVVFLDSDDLLTLTLPLALETIEANAFENVGAEKIIIPNGARTIGSNAFANNGQLKIVVVPASVNSIAQDAFDNGVIIQCEPESTAYYYAIEHHLGVIN